MHEKFQALAEQQLSTLLSKLPDNPGSRFVLFLEALRILDYRTIVEPSVPEERRISPQLLSIMRWGWGLAASHLLRPLDMNGIPMGKSDAESLKAAEQLLYHFGLVVLMRRAAEMVRCGYLSVAEVEGVLSVTSVDFMAYQHVDNLEFDRWHELQEQLDTSEASTHGGWSLHSMDRIHEVERRIGAYIGRGRHAYLKKWERPDVDALMVPLIRPWDSGYGVMMAYGARKEVDDHFGAEGMKLAESWISDVGLDPRAAVGASTGADVTAVTAIIAALHLKHIHFGRLASKHQPTISIPISLTIWEPAEQLAQALADYTGFKVERIQRALDVITLPLSEADRLPKFSAFDMPLLLDLENGYVLRPVSSVVRNPLVSALAMIEWRDPAGRSRLIASLEEWMRRDLYALFQGSRYFLADRNIKVRDGDRIATDIDAAILDKTTGELALIQLKWQDYFTNDVRKLRSRSSNLTTELDEWAGVVSEWIERVGLDGVTKSLRLNSRKDGAIRSVRRQGWQEESILSLENSTKSVVERFADPAATSVHSTKGLVVGYVQSGKTANFTGVIARAADAGYRLIP